MKYHKNKHRKIQMIIIIMVVIIGEVQITHTKIRLHHSQDQTYTCNGAYMQLHMALRNVALAYALSACLQNLPAAPCHL